MTDVDADGTGPDTMLDGAAGALSHFPSPPASKSSSISRSRPACAVRSPELVPELSAEFTIAARFKHRIFFSAGGMAPRLLSATQFKKSLISSGVIFNLGFNSLRPALRFNIPNSINSGISASTYPRGSIARPLFTATG